MPSFADFIYYGGPALAVFGLTVVAGLFGLPLLRRLGLGQTVRDDGPQSHFKKSGTPTFGGLFFLIPLAAFGLYAWLSGSYPQELAVLILLMLLFALVGFIDDWTKVKIDKKGLSVKRKSILLFVISCLFCLYYLYLAPQPAFFLLPISGRVIQITGWARLPYAVFTVLALFFTSNSVNLTDGVDGLASSVTAVSSTGFALAGLFFVPAGSSTKAAVVAGWLILAACLGFLLFNRHPARVFMGDTGSQALGAGIAGMGFFLGAPWLILFLGVIYMSESLSVIIQVIYFRKTGGKRIFRMSPLHHHYELGGWSENKIVLVFTLVTVLGCALGIALL